MDGINIKKSEALEVLSMTIQCDVHWNRHIFQCLSFLRRGMILWCSYYLHHLQPKENDIQLSCVGWCLNVYFETTRPPAGEGELLVNDGRVSNSINSVEYHCNVAFTVLSLLQPILLQRGVKKKSTYSWVSCIPT